MNYPVVIHKTKKSDYGVSVPDLPGCISAGRTVDEALAMIREAIELHLEGIIEEGGIAPLPTPIEQLRTDPDYADGTWAIVNVDTDRMSIAEIQRHGDPLERHMFADLTFSGWFGAYATVWANHVLHRRQDDGLVESGWEEFAQRNYTAIVRCWNAWEIQQQIKNILVKKPPSVERQLELHGLLAGFFAMMRAAQENLHEAFVDKAGQDKTDFGYVDDLDTGYPNLGWVRYTRNDLLHNRTLPMGVNPSGVVEVDRSLLPRGDGTSIPWHDGIGDWLPLITLVNDVWDNFPSQMDTLWTQLDTRLVSALPSSSASSGPGREGAGQRSRPQSALPSPSASSGPGRPTPSPGPGAGSDVPASGVINKTLTDTAEHSSL